MYIFTTPSKDTRILKVMPFQGEDPLIYLTLIPRQCAKMEREREGGGGGERERQREGESMKRERA